ncbi:prepilin peptidase [Pseudoclavibacter sp. CFCC 13796]|uniref:prepilin peptidase n=1 Tax=Pseudoclavibacter sp. CFCC 13796 TaxID=2615179 RepID=UPI0017879533|nr:A24 family peptidase [Pseudoclavibacter sp. CFCC 13796]
MLALVAAFGVVVGSFLNVVIYRTPRGIPLAVGRSHCPSCLAQLTWWENIPILSWMVLRGRCGHCGSSISARYPLVEASNMLVWMVLWISLQPTDVAAIVQFVLLACTASTLLVITWTDIDTGLIPNTVTLHASLIGVELAIIWVLLQPMPEDAARGAVIGAVAYGLPVMLFALFGGMGMGDAKLAPLLGLTLGSLGVPYLVVGVSAPYFLALPAALHIMRQGRGGRLVFGPALAAGWLLAVVFAPAISALVFRA